MNYKNFTDACKINRLVVATVLLTCVLFVVSFFLNKSAEITTKIISILYLVMFIIFLIFRRSYKKTVIVKGKRTRKKKFTGSTYRKIFHKRECRFADSIKDQYFIENDKADFFLDKGYKACKLCMGKKTDSSNLREKKRI